MPVYTGSFWALFNPFALVAGVVSLAMIVAHGANYLILRTEGAIQERARKAAVVAGALMLAGFALGGIMVANMPGFVLHPGLDAGSAINPLDKVVTLAPGTWLANFKAHPALWLVPAAGFLGGALGIFFALRRRGALAFISSAVAEFGVIFTAGVAIFPFVLPSTSDPKSSLTAWDCVSSKMTLEIMFWVALIMTPIIIAYTSWAYRVMRGKVTVEFIKANDKATY